MRPRDIKVMEWNQKMSEVKVQTRGLQPTRTGWTSRPITESGTSQLVCPAHIQTRPWPNNKLIDPTSIRQTRLAASHHFISFSFFFLYPCAVCVCLNDKLHIFLHVWGLNKPWVAFVQAVWPRCGAHKGYTKEKVRKQGAAHNTKNT